MLSHESTSIASLIGELRVGQRYALEGMAQTALREAGVIADPPYLVALGNAALQNLPRITQAQGEIRRAFDAFCTGQAPDKV